MDYLLWAGSQDSYQAYANLQKFLLDPKYVSDLKMKASMFEEDELTPDYEGIGGHLVSVEGGVAVVTISGSLVNSYSPWNKYFGIVAYPEIRSAIEQAVDDPLVEKILMNYDTGGGMVSGIDETAQFLIQAGTVKPIYAYTSTAALSGGYWLASTAKKIFASKTAQLGSVGVITVQVSQNRMYEKEGFDIKVFRAGKNKALGHPLEELSEAAQEKIQADIDTIYGFFTSHISEMRGIPLSSKNQWADGNVFYANEAKALNLVDGVTYFNILTNSLRKSLNNSLLSEQSLDTDVKQMKYKTAVKTEAELAKIQAGVLGVETHTDESEDTPKEDLSEKPDVETEKKPDVETETKPDVEVTLESAPSESAINLSATQDKLIAVSNKLAISENDLQKVTAELVAKEAKITSLIDVVAIATNRLQIGLNQTPMNLAGLPVETVLDQWSSTNKLFSETFKIGVQSKAVKTSEDQLKIKQPTKIRAIDSE